MNKRIAILIISLLIAAVAVLGVLFYVSHTDQANQIDTLNADVADKAAQITTLNADVADKAAQITTLNADVADKTAQITTLNADVADKAAQITTLNADVADKAAQITTLNADVADKAAQITTLNADVADKAAQITTLNADVADKAAQITTLNADVASKAEQITTLNANVAERDTRITGLLASVTDLDAQVSLLAVDVFNKSNTISALNKQVTEQKTKLDAQAKEAETATASITALTQTQAELKAQIEELQKGPDFQSMTEKELKAYADTLIPHLTELGYIVSMERPVWKCISCGQSNNRQACSRCELSREDSSLLSSIGTQPIIYIWHRETDDSVYRLMGNTVYPDDYNAEELQICGGIILCSQQEKDVPITLSADVDGRKYAWDPSTLKPGKEHGFVLSSTYLSKGDHTIKWYINDVCVLTEIYHARDGHSALYNQLMSEVSTSCTTAIYNKNTNKLVSDHIKIPALDQLEKNEIFSPRLKITNNSAKALSGFYLSCVTNGEIIYWSDRNISANSSATYWTNAPTYEVGSNEYVWYINGIELTRTTLELLETSK